MIQRMADASRQDCKKRSLRKCPQSWFGRWQMKPICQGVRIVPHGWDDVAPDMGTATGTGRRSAP